MLNVFVLRGGVEKIDYLEAVFHEEAVFADNNCLWVVVKGPFPSEDTVWVAIGVSSSEEASWCGAEASLGTLAVFR